MDSLLKFCQPVAPDSWRDKQVGRCGLAKCDEGTGRLEGARTTAKPGNWIPTKALERHMAQLESIH